MLNKNNNYLKNVQNVSYNSNITLFYQIVNFNKIIYIA